MMKSKVRMADIAKRLNISVVTVSKALTGKKGVSEKLRAQINDVAREIGYIPMQRATRKMEKDNGNIGVLISGKYTNKSSAFYWAMYEKLTKALLAKGCFGILEIVHVDEEKNCICPRVLLENKVDGLIWYKKSYSESCHEAIY